MSENNLRILHVDDRDTWTELVEMCLEDEEGYELTLFNNLPKAKKYYEENSDSIDLVISDGTINESDDGRFWASKLFAAGQKVFILSTDGWGEVPFMEKGNISKENLIAKIQEVVG